MTRGMVGRIPQSMSARKGGARLQVLSDSGLLAAAATGTITATETCQALIYLRGAGGAGLNSAGAAPGGGGAAALFKRVSLRKGDVLAYSIGAGVLNLAGGDTTVTLPGGRVLRAGGGQPGAGTVGGAGGIATGGDINRNGGAGGDDGAGGGDATAGQPGQGLGAGTGGAAATEGGADVAGGGGAGGITEEPLFPAAANGVAGGNQGAAYGGGGGGRNATTGIGGDGVGRIILVRQF